MTLESMFGRFGGDLFGGGGRRGRGEYDRGYGGGDRYGDGGYF